MEYTKEYVSDSTDGAWTNRYNELTTRQDNFKKIVIPPTCVWFCYLLNGICFHFHLCVTGIMLHCL